MRRQSDTIRRALIDLAQPDGPADVEQTLEPLAGGLSELYLDLVEHHRLTLALLDAVRSTGYQLADQPEQRLRHQEADDRATRLRIQRARREVTDALTGLTWVVLKGETIAAAMTRPHVRVYNDLDLLVHPSQMRAAADALIEAGFEELNQNWPAYLQHMVGEVPFTGFGATVDLHWQLVPLERSRRTIRFDVEALLSRRIHLGQGSDTFPALAPEDQLLHVATHCALGGAKRLDQLRDLAVIANQSGSLDWDRITHRAEQWGVRRLAGVALDRSAQIIGWSPPAAALSLADGRFNTVRRMADQTIGIRRLPAAIARDSAAASFRSLIETAADGLHSRVTGSSRWDFSNPSSRLYYADGIAENGNGTDEDRCRYYRTVGRQA